MDLLSIFLWSKVFISNILTSQSYCCIKNKEWMLCYKFFVIDIKIKCMMKFFYISPIPKLYFLKTSFAYVWYFWPAGTFVRYNVRAILNITSKTNLHWAALLHIPLAETIKELNNFILKGVDLYDYCTDYYELYFPYF